VSSHNNKRGSSHKAAFRFDGELDKVIHTLTKNNPALAQNTKVSLAWETITSPYIYTHTTGVVLRGSKLTISVDIQTLITDLSAMSEFYREAINERMGGEAVSLVRFVLAKRGRETSPVPSSQKRSGQQDQDLIESVPLSDLDVAQLEDSVSAIKNPKLREALLKATIADLEWKKGIESSKRAQKPNQGA
jgi:hypothetical protein